MLWREPGINLLAVSASVRKGGNTDLVLEYVSRIVQRVDARLTTIHLRDHRITPCGRCGNCNDRSSPCRQTDDVADIVERMIQADGIIYATPVYGFGMSHLMQTFIERAGVGYLRFERPLHNKVGGAIITGRRYNHGHIYSQLASNMLLNRMILPGSGFPALLYGGKPGEAMADEEGLDSVYRMTIRMVEMARCLKTYNQITHGNGLPLATGNERTISSAANELAAISK